MTAGAATIAIRADGSPAMGGGHIVRCVALARALRDSGSEPRLFVNSEAAPLISSQDVRGLAVDFVGPGPAAFAAALAALAKDKPVDVVIDHYGWARHEESQLRGLARQIVVIDDLANRPHDCDILIDQNYGRKAEDYVGLVPRFARCLVGPRYALLRQEFPAMRRAALRRRETATQAKRILVSLGLTDVGSVTLSTVRAIRAAGIQNPIDVVVSRTAPSLDGLRRLDDPALEVHVEPPNLALLMCEADLAVGAAGTSIWERCCLGLPTVMLILAENQREVADRVREGGIAAAFEASKEGIAEAAACLGLLLNDSARRREMSNVSSMLVDGRGAFRCAQAILAPAVCLRAARVDDEEQMLLWRNEDLVRAVSRTKDKIGAAQHHAWFSSLLRDGDRIALIAEDHGTAVGMVRLEPDTAHEPGAHKISVILAPAMRGRGLAKQVVGQAIAQTRAARDDGPVYAEITNNNARSHAVFHALGFTLQQPADADGFCLYRRASFGDNPARRPVRGGHIEPALERLAMKEIV